MRIRLHIECKKDAGIPDDIEQESEFRVGYIEFDHVKGFYRQQTGGSVIYYSDDDCIFVKEEPDIINGLLERAEMKANKVWVNSGN